MMTPYVDQIKPHVAGPKARIALEQPDLCNKCMISLISFVHVEQSELTL